MSFLKLNYIHLRSVGVEKSVKLNNNLRVSWKPSVYYNNSHPINSHSLVTNRTLRLDQTHAHAHYTLSCAHVWTQFVNWADSCEADVWISQRESKNIHILFLLISHSGVWAVYGCVCGREWWIKRKMPAISLVQCVWILYRDCCCIAC